MTTSRVISRSDSGTNPCAKSIPKRDSKALSCHGAQNNTGQVRHLDEFKVTNTATGLNKVHTTRSAETTALWAMHFHGPASYCCTDPPKAGVTLLPQNNTGWKGPAGETSG